MAESLIQSLTVPIGPLYLWTWLMLVTVLVVLPAGLYVTRDWEEVQR